MARRRAVRGSLHHRAGAFDVPDGATRRRGSSRRSSAFGGRSRVRCFARRDARRRPEPSALLPIRLSRGASNRRTPPRLLLSRACDRPVLRCLRAMRSSARPRTAALAGERSRAWSQERVVRARGLLRLTEGPRALAARLMRTCHLLRRDRRRKCGCEGVLADGGARGTTSGRAHADPRPQQRGCLGAGA
jgi:hypothetical protein